ncbi:Transcription initiation factor TFIID subunit 4B [Varanus komodoensis]|nr:Transcription initiation factor TFIID subunit 4B [Varanus komodoensis]
MQQLELAQIQQMEANRAALAAIGPRKKRPLDSPNLVSRVECCRLSHKVRSLGVLLDLELSLEAQVTAAARSAFLQLRLIHQLCPYLEYDCLATVTHALVTSHLDFCNALYVGLPLKTVRILQLVQNRAARLLTGTGRYAHMTPVLRQLHWLPIEVRAQFKVLVMTYKALNGSGPGYLKEHLHPYMPSRPLRSVGEALLREPSVKEIRRDSRTLSLCQHSGLDVFPENFRGSHAECISEPQSTAVVHKSQSKDKLDGSSVIQLHSNTYVAMELCNSIHCSKGMRLAQWSTSYKQDLNRSPSLAKPYLRPRIIRICLRDLIFCMEQEREMKHSLALYQALLK